MALDVQEIKKMKRSNLQKLAKKHAINASATSEFIRQELFKKLGLVDPDVPPPDTETSFTQYESASHTGPFKRVARTQPSSSAMAGPSTEIEHVASNHAAPTLMLPPTLIPPLTLVPPAPSHPVLPHHDSAIGYEPVTILHPLQSDPSTFEIISPTFHLQPIPEYELTHAATDPRLSTRARLQPIATQLPLANPPRVFFLPEPPTRNDFGPSIKPVSLRPIRTNTQEPSLESVPKPLLSENGPAGEEWDENIAIKKQRKSSSVSPTGSWSESSMNEHRSDPPSPDAELEQQPELPQRGDASLRPSHRARVAAAAQNTKRLPGSPSPDPRSAQQQAVPEHDDDPMLSSHHAKGTAAVYEVKRVEAIFEIYEGQHAEWQEILNVYAENAQFYRQRTMNMRTIKQIEGSRIERLRNYLVDFRNIPREWGDEHIYAHSVLAKPIEDGKYKELWSDTEGYDEEGAIMLPAYVVHGVPLENRNLKRGRDEGEEDNYDEAAEPSASTHKRRRVEAPEPIVQPHDDDETEEAGVIADASGPLLSPPTTPSRTSKEMPPPSTVGKREALEEREVVDILSAPIRDSSVAPFSPDVCVPSPPPRRKNVRTRPAPPPLPEVSPEPSTPPRRTRAVKKGKRRAN